METIKYAVVEAGYWRNRGSSPICADVFVCDTLKEAFQDCQSLNSMLAVPHVIIKKVFTPGYDSLYCITIYNNNADRDGILCICDTSFTREDLLEKANVYNQELWSRKYFVKSTPATETISLVESI